MQLGDYKCRISIRAGQVVEQLSMVLNITEPDGIVRLSTTGPEQEGVASLSANVDCSADGTQAIVRYLPTTEAQRAVQNNRGIAGDLVVSYDVNHQNGIGDITVVQDTVIHSFAPKDLPPLPKNIAFVIDISGSMSGHKIEQTLQAMLTILDQLREEDMFMIILFEANLRYWPTVHEDHRGAIIRETASHPITTVQPPQYSNNRAPIGPGRTLLLRPAPAPAIAAAPSAPYYLNRGTRQAPGSNTGVPWSAILHSTTQPPLPSVPGSTAGMVRATARNVALAKEFAIRNIRASGGTNINSALLEACRILHSQRRTKGNLILFLTDGSPTSGVTDPRHIVENVATAAKETSDSGRISIYSLAFGFSLDYDLLEMVSLNTEGKVKRIYAESDAADQLRNFYQEISTPLMYNLHFIPDADVVDEKTITQNKFPTFFEGSEILVMWKIKPELLNVNLVLNRKKRSEQHIDGQIDGDLPRAWVNPAPTTKKPKEVEYLEEYVWRCGAGLEGYTTEPVEYNTEIEINPRITLSDQDDRARKIDCLHVDDPEYNIISNSTWIPTEFAERMWANLKIKNLLKVSKLSKNERKKRQAEKTAICLALKYHLVTPVTSLLVIQGPTVSPEPQVEQSHALCLPTCGVPGSAGNRGTAYASQGQRTPQGSPSLAGSTHSWNQGTKGTKSLGQSAAQGPPGRQGTPGSRGESGLPGRDGSAGERGPPGPMSTFYGSTAPRGEPGLPGPSGPGERGTPAQSLRPGPQGQSDTPTDHGSTAARGESGMSRPAGQREQGTRAPRGPSGQDGWPGPTSHGNRGAPGPSRPGQRGESGPQGENGRSEDQGPRGPPVQEDRRLLGQLGDRGIPGLNGTPGLDGTPGFRGENERSGNRGSMLHISITTPRSTTSSASSAITSSMSTAKGTISNMTTSTAPSTTTPPELVTTTTRKTTTTKFHTTTTTGRPTTTSTKMQKTTTSTAPSKIITTTTSELMPSTTTAIDLKATENKTDTDCNDEICENPILTGQINEGSESLEDNHVNQSVHTANMAEPKAVPVSKESGSVPLISSLYVTVNAILLLIVSSTFS